MLQAINLAILTTNLEASKETRIDKVHGHIPDNDKQMRDV
jgi:hypothetical protein